MMLGGPVLAAGDHLGCLRRAQRAARRGGIPRGRPDDGEPSTRQPRRTNPPPSCTAATTSPGGTRAGAAGNHTQPSRRADERSDVCETPTQRQTAPRRSVGVFRLWPVPVARLVTRTS